MRGIGFVFVTIVIGCSEESMDAAEPDASPPVVPDAATDAVADAVVDATGSSSADPEAASESEIDNYCRALLRRQECATSEDPGFAGVGGCNRTQLARSTGEALGAIADCYDGLACDENDDRCLEMFFVDVDEAEARACSERLEDCHDDAHVQKSLCVGLATLTTANLELFRDCLATPECDAMQDCMRALFAPQ